MLALQLQNQNEDAAPVRNSATGAGSYYVTVRVCSDVNSFVPFRRQGMAFLSRYALLFTLIAIASPLLFAGSTQTAAAQTKPKQTMPVPLSPVYRFAGGQSAAYHLDYSTNAAADLNVLFADQNLGPKSQPKPSSANLAYAFAASLQSDLDVTTVKATDQKVECFVAFRNLYIRVALNGQEQSEQAKKMAVDLGRGLLLDLSPRGKIISFYMPPDTERASQDFARTLLALTQFVVPEPSRNSEVWTAVEEDRNGIYTARYRVLRSFAEHPDLLTIQKSKLRYLPEASPSKEDALPGRSPAQKTVLPKMNLEASFDAGRGQLASLKGTEALDTSIQGKTVAHSETRFSFTRTGEPAQVPVETARVQDLAQSLTTNSPPLKLFVQRSQKEIETNIQRTELGTETLDDLLAKLAGVKKDSEQVNTALYLKFKALIYVHPESCPRIGEVLASADAPGTSFKLLAAALGAVGHDQAQSALAHAIQARPKDPQALLTLVATLGAVPHPSVEAERTIKELVASANDPNVLSTAILSLGNMVHSLARRDVKRSGAILDYLLERLAEAKNEDEKKHLIEAMGNSGSDRVLPELSRLAADPSPVLRAAAIDGVRFTASPQVDDLLMHTLGSDTDAHVRLEAAFSLGFRKSSAESFATQKRLLATETDEKVRAALVSNLAKMFPQFPEAKKLVKQAADSDASEYVRKVAGGLLPLMLGTSSRSASSGVRQK